MSNRDLNAIISYLFDAVISNQEIPLTSSLPDEVQDDLRFASKLHNVDMSSESRIRQRLRNQLEMQSTMQQNADHLLKGVSKPGHTPTRHSGAALLGISLGAAAVVMATLLIFLHSPEKSEGDEMVSEEMEEVSPVEMIS